MDAETKAALLGIAPNETPQPHWFTIDEAMKLWNLSHGRTAHRLREMEQAGKLKSHKCKREGRQTLYYELSSTGG